MFLESMASLLFDALELLEQRFDARRHLAPFDRPFALLALERLGLGDQLAEILPAQLLVDVLRAPRQLVAFLLEPVAVGAQLLNHARGPLDAVRETIEIRKHHGRGFVHRSLKRPPHCCSTALTMRS